MTIPNETDRQLANLEENASAVVVNAGTEQLKNDLRKVIPPELYALHNDGRIHIHDLEFYRTAYNCIGIDVDDYAAGAPDLHTALNRLFRGIAELTNRQSGGIGILHFDQGLSAYLHDEDEASVIRDFIDFFENLNLPLRKGCEKAYITLNFGAGTSTKSRAVASAMLKAYDSGNYIFPNLVFTVKQGINAQATDPCFDLFCQAAQVTARHMNPTYLNLDAPFNQGIAPERSGIMGCRTRVSANRFDRNGALHRGNIAAVSINLVQLALESGEDPACFLHLLDIEMKHARSLLLHRFETLLREGDLHYIREHALYLEADRRNTFEMLKNGTLSIGFIGLWESLCVLHDDASLLCREDSRMINVPADTLRQYMREGLDIVRHMRAQTDRFCSENNLNFSLLASSGEGISGIFPQKTARMHPEARMLRHTAYYTNSFHIPVYVNVSAFEKIELEAPFHALCNGGHITYVELAEAPLGNGNAVQELVLYACGCGIGYFGINYPLDICNTCGHSGTFTVCPLCGKKDIRRLRRVSGYLSEARSMAIGKREELKHRAPNIGKIEFPAGG